MTIVGALILVGITVFLILQPVISGEEAPLSSAGEEPTDAQFRKRVSLLQLRDAEYEYAMGKLGEEDYQTLRTEISAEALEAIRAEEEETRAGSGSFEGPTDAELEEEIAAVRTRLAGGSFCSACGHPNPAGSRFCGDCGTKLGA
ncbi:MAG: zinc-ribbon domain-containing protein [Gemmatimonadota bacterium]|jgi:cytochrome c-type biogenesis protein CcmI